MCLLFFVMWKTHTFPEHIQQFMACWGMHGLGPFAVMLFYGTLIPRKNHSTKIILGLGAFCAVLSTLNEVSQIWREGVYDLWDIVAQVVGVALGVVLLLRWPPK